jgi:hypothetical protein
MGGVRVVAVAGLALEADMFEDNGDINGGDFCDAGGFFAKDATAAVSAALSFAGEGGGGARGGGGIGGNQSSFA